MGALDSPLRQLASTLISTFVDNFATLVRISAAGYDPVTGEEIQAAIQSYSVKTTPPEKYRDIEINGTSVKQYDLRVYIAAQDIAISPTPRTDTIAIGNVVHNVIKVTSHFSGDQVCLWELQLRS